jgi:hypothetical protein
MIQRWLLKRPRFHLHFTLTSSSWLNMVERWFAELTEKQIRRGSHRSVNQLENAIQRYIAICNEDPKPFMWVKTELPHFCGDEVKQINVFEPALHVEQSGGPPRMGKFKVCFMGSEGLGSVLAYSQSTSDPQTR